MRTDTPMEALAAARKRAIDADMAHWHIVAAAFCYAYRHPEWFTSWRLAMYEHQALTDAAFKAETAGDNVAFLLLQAAADLVFVTDLFEGES